MKAAFVVFNRLTSLDFIGFYDPITRLKSMKILDDFDWRLCSITRSVVDDRGLAMEAGTDGARISRVRAVDAPDPAGITSRVGLSAAAGHSGPCLPRGSLARIPNTVAVDPGARARADVSFQL